MRDENAPEKQAGMEKQPERCSWTVTTPFPSEEAVLSLQAGDACKLLGSQFCSETDDPEA